MAGLGLVGGSLARALTRAGCRVIGLDAPAVARRAKAAGAIALTAPRIEAAASLADVLFLAAPPRANLRLLRRLARVAPPALSMTDVGSVKGTICRQAERLGLARFVGGHPVAGSERSGFGASSADLFRGRPWILTPTAASGPALASLRKLVRATGAHPLVMSAEAHDRAMAFLSHLPQVVSWGLLDAARRDGVARVHFQVAGPGFRDMTRLARSPRRLWREILGENRREVGRALEAFRVALKRLV